MRKFAPLLFSTITILSLFLTACGSADLTLVPVSPGVPAPGDPLEGNIAIPGAFVQRLFPSR